ncbi:MAG: FAD-dependent oxidoreductase, partial [bacterium]|nr:FAD-dependent oxidoreductase [bacterium]
KGIEPDLQAAEGLLSPSTGIVDSHAFSTALLGDAEAHGTVLALHSPLIAAKHADNGFVLTVGAGDGVFKMRCREIVNAAALSASAVARMLGTPAGRVPRTYLAKGNYFGLLPRSPFEHLVYPVPVPGGLGTHLTLDLAGRARFGPDVEWVDRIDHAVDPSRAVAFYDAIRRYWPGLRDGSLVADYAGIRPKISGPGSTGADFLIQGPADHGIEGLVNLFGIESPGLTASLAIADYVASLLHVRRGAVRSKAAALAG